MTEHTDLIEQLVRERTAKVVQAERLNAVTQVVDGLLSAVNNTAASFPAGVAGINQMPCLVSVYDRNEQVVAVNQLCIIRLGDMTGRNRSEIYTHGRGQSAKSSSVAETFNTGKVQRSRETVRTLDGREVPVVVHTAPIRNRSNKVELVLELTAEIPEINRLAEELRVTQQHYRQLFDEAPCYISVLDKSLRIVATNRCYENDFGHTLGSRCYEVCKQRDQPCPDCPVLSTIEEGKPRTAEAVVTSQKGEEYNVLIRTAPLRDASGEIVQVMEMSTNITEIKKLQDRLSCLGVLIGSISHGMKGLLTGLDGGIYMIDSGLAAKNPERIREGWDSLKLTLRNLKRMILDLLYYSKEQDLGWERVQVASFAVKIAATFQQKLKDRQVEFKFEIPDSMQEFYADPGALSSALMNLLENASDACIQDKSKSHHQVFFSITESAEDVLFDVRDNGPGMDEKTKNKLFTPCFSTKGTKGTGLGLFISKEIVQRHGGSITVKSVPGQGCCFSVRVPKQNKQLKGV